MNAAPALLLAAASVWAQARPAKTAPIRWIKIPGGSFTMGSDEGPSFSAPAHRVTVKTFEFAKTPVTKAQYAACVDAGACPAPHCDWPPAADEGDLPVVCVEWSEAKKFSEWAGGRLPTEAEFEYAARSAGKEWDYPWGREPANCERAALSGCGDKAAAVCATPKGNSKQGLCDLAGNVWEWTQDWYHDSFHGAPGDGSAWETPAGEDRVVRGGSWNTSAWYLRTDNRSGGAPGARGAILGFRPARDVVKGAAGTP